MLKKFLSYYRPHLRLFILDMLVASAMSMLLIFFPYLTRNLLRSHIPENNVPMIIWSLTALTCICLFMLVLNYIRIKWGHILGVRMEADMRGDIFRHVQKLSFTWFDNTKTGHIMSRISNDLNMIAEVAHHAPEDLLISLVVLIGAYIFMFSFSLPLALISLVPFPFMLIWGIIFGGRMRSGFRKVRKEIAEINSTVENSVQGIREVKAFANEELEEEKFHNSNTTFRYAKENAYTAMAGFHSVIHFLRDSYYLVVVGGGVLLIYHGLIEVYDLLSFVLFVGIILPPIDRLINFNEQLQQGTAAFERFVEIMEIEPDIADRPGAKDLAQHSREICFKDVHFSYSGSPEPVLKGINLTIPFGSKVALVGESGAGKSTLVSLIPRFYEVNQGEISIDGMDVKNLSQKSLREQTGIVQQNVFLFDTSLRENIMYGNPLATEAQMIQAASWANIIDFIQNLPEGFDTEVGERGVKLSGGQKQRIAIARVFLKNPPILILDEATSSLDTESETLIQNAMFRLAENRTTIIIAHRLSTVRNVDRIYVMREGRIIEEGTHSELLELNGYYERLYTQRRL
jgi:ATP-binding cassette subfamily B protein